MRWETSNYCTVGVKHHASALQSVHLTKAAKIPYKRLFITIHQFVFYEK